MSGQRFEQSIVDGSRNCTRKASPSLRCRSCRTSLIEALRGSQFAQITRRMAQRFDLNGSARPCAVRGMNCAMPSAPWETTGPRPEQRLSRNLHRAGRPKCWCIWYRRAKSPQCRSTTKCSRTRTSCRRTIRGLRAASSARSASSGLTNPATADETGRSNYFFGSPTITNGAQKLG